MSDPRLYDSLRRIESSTVDRQVPAEGYVADKDAGGATIFITNYNHRAFLPRSLRSALAALGALEEAGFSGEILVVDDASRDGSQKFLRSVQALYNEPRLKTLCLRQNFGQARLRNLGLRMSAFRYVCMLDADNELLAENLPLFLQSIKGTGAAMVYGNLIDEEDGEVTGARSNMPPTLRLTRANYIDSFSIFDAQRLLNLGGFTRVHPYVPEDWEMVLHLINEEERMVFVPVVFGYYHKHPLSASRELSLSESGRDTLRRVHAQTGTREWDDVQVGRIYHPDVGFLDEWV